MTTRLEQVLAKCLKGREIAVWGNPTRALLRALQGHKFHIADAVDPLRNYVVAVDDSDLSDFLSDEQSKSFRYACDYLTFEDKGGELPFEWECYGVPVGRQTYMSDDFADACCYGYVKSVGHFTSINGTADMGVNHQLGMTFVSDDIETFFTDDNKALFRQKLNEDPRHPYAIGKEKITIGSDVYIGANAFINASRVTNIGDGAIIGSGAVVLADVPPYAVVAGVPAKVIRYRFEPGMIGTLLKVKWWEWDVEKINANADALMTPEIFYERFRKI